METKEMEGKVKEKKGRLNQILWRENNGYLVKEGKLK